MPPLFFFEYSLIRSFSGTKTSPEESGGICFHHAKNGSHRVAGLVLDALDLTCNACAFASVGRLSFGLLACNIGNTISPAPVNARQSSLQGLPRTMSRRFAHARFPPRGTGPAPQPHELRPYHEHPALHQNPVPGRVRAARAKYCAAPSRRWCLRDFRSDRGVPLVADLERQNLARPLRADRPQPPASVTFSTPARFAF